MRHISTLTMLLVVCATPTLAQGTSKGVRGGLNLSTTNVTGENDSGTQDWQPRGVFGGFITWQALSWLELQPEVLYAMKGAKREEFGISSKLLLDYLEIPVLARFSRGAPARSWYAVAGPSFGYLLRARARADFGNATEELDIIDDVERFDFGIVAGAGIEFGRFLIDGRYGHGLGNIDKLSGEAGKITNRAVSVTVGYKF